MKLIPWDRQWLPELVDLWNKVLGDKFPMRASLFEQNSFNDENILHKGSQIVLDAHEEVIGFIVVKKWREQMDVPMRNDLGWIQVLLVAPQYRHQGIGSKLLKHAERILKEEGCQEILLGKDPWHYFPGIPLQSEETVDWFERRGYQKFGQEHDLICNYHENTEVVCQKFQMCHFRFYKKIKKSNF